MKAGKILKHRYQIAQELKRGVFGKTYVAFDNIASDQRLCIVKQFQPITIYPAIVEEARRRFEQEVKVLESLSQHPQIPQLWDYFEENQEFYLIQEFIEGQDLNVELQESPPWTEDQAIAFLEEVLNILLFIHQHRVIHRDIKPSNLIHRKQDRQWVLTDFGGIREIETLTFASSEALTLTGEVYSFGVGTPGYMALEQLVGQPQFNSDIYALGITTVQALTGLHPLKIPRDPKTYQLLWRKDIEVSESFAEVLEAMILPDFRDRYQSAEAVLRALQKFQVVPEIETPPPVLLQFDMPRVVNASFAGVSTQGLEYPLRLDPVLESLPHSEVPEPPSRVNVVSPPEPVTVYTYTSESLPVARPDRYFPANEPPSPRQRIPQKYLWRGGLLGGGAIALLFFLPMVQFKYAMHFCDHWLDLERPEEALPACERASVLQPSNAQALTNQGDALSGLDRYEAALVIYDKALQDQPNFSQAWNGRGEVLYRLQRYSEALKTRDEAIALNPQDAGAHQGRGIVLIGMGKFEEALAAFEKAITLKPKDAFAWENKGLAMEYLQRSFEANAAYSEAIALLEKQIKQQPQNLKAYIDKGRVLGKLRRHEEALTAYEAALKINPQYYPAWIGKGSTLFFLKRFEEALAAYHQAAEIRPKYYLTWHNQGSLLADGLQRYSEAIEAYAKAVDLNPSFVPAWRDRGSALIQLKQYNEAIASFDQALRIEPNDYQSWASRGIALAKLQRYDEALAAFDKASAINPTDPITWANRAWMLSEAQRYPDAIAAYDRAIEIKPDFQPAIQARRQIQAKLAQSEP